MQKNFMRLTQVEHLVWLHLEARILVLTATIENRVVVAYSVLLEYR